ncbi:hypothetical protein M513_04549 [Trichuris suis]|uniref:Membrane-bound transcription factor site-2 protease n=1 Tax=Trichuris suis TaxID=68888 RepID=A0A085MBK8_9BILA|nr:hypothetical protein M513_04549 [Trichuris suis]
MNKLLGCLSLLLLCSFVSCGSSEPMSNDLGRLVFLHLVWRHGDRAPVDNFTSNPDKATAWPVGLGELTKLGIQEHYKLGEYLRKRYSDFLPAAYNAKTVHVRSTDYNRTIMSALANLAGLFPLQSHHRWSANVSWQPVPVHSVPGVDDDVDIVKQNGDFFTFLRNQTGLPLTSLNDIRFVYDPLNCARIHKHLTPYWVSDEVFQKIRDLFALSTTYWYKGDEHKRLRGGTLLKDILMRMLSVSNNRTNSAFKLYAYSGHDATLVALFENLGIYDVRLLPGYTSVIIFELREISARYFVRILYKNGIDAQEVLLKLPFCEENCPLDDFVERFDHCAPINWKSECGLESKPFAWKTYALVFFVMTVIAVNLLVAQTVYFVHKQRREIIFAFKVTCSLDNFGQRREAKEWVYDALMRRARVKCYQRFLERTELTLGFFYAKLYVFRMNDIIPVHAQRMPNRTRIALNCWFTVGVVATCILGILAVRFLFLNVVQLFNPSSTSLELSDVTSWNKGEVKSTGGLVAVIPGVNMPWCHVPLLFFVLALCATFHEFGHAVAAMNEDILVDGFGFIFFLIFPGAFTDLNRYDLKQCSAFKKLKVYCAGVWHNLCLSAVASLLLRLNWPADDKNIGVMIHGMDGLSLAAFPYELADGEIIYSINGCRSDNVESWLSCLDGFDMEKPGYCFPHHIVHKGMNQPEDIRWKPTKEDFCFFFRLSQSNVSSHGYLCVSHQEIMTSETCGYSVPCAENFPCVIPGLLKTSRLFYFTLGRKRDGMTFVITSINDLYSINVTESAAVCNVYSNVDIVEVLLRLTAALSFAFALLNAVPCFGLDGHYLVDAVAKSVMPLTTGNGPHYIAVASQVLSFVGTCLVVVSILVALLPYFTTLA